ncbi:hypothetical protein BDK89_4136 [Ilumatobacter fluminis]|uniref:Uncharacterized protein n=2 Tax=Ilumatobacter fluminis TaxID=467091 RepID=A0A4R7I4Q9_9ACTN|nr:hypothetical protein BDK89_4136 [Ilumatobacter fluminis]
MGFAATIPVAVQREDREYMTSEIDEFRTSLVAAVQAELERHASAVVAEVDRLRDESRREREELRAEFTGQIAELAQAIEQSQARAEQRVETAKTQFESRLTDADQRQTRRLDEVTAGLQGMVAAEARPILSDLREENEEISRRIEGLDTNLRKFDEQAARMVTYFNDATSQMEARQDELAEKIELDMSTKVDDLTRLVEENDSAVRKFQNEVGQSVTQRLNDAEDRFNNRLLAAQSRIQEESGQKIAEIDLHVSRVSSNLDESLAVMNDRIAAVDDRFVEYERQIKHIEEQVEGIDQDALDELKEKMSTAAGEAMLVRIEMERLEKGVNERTDSLAVRMTEVETSLQDQVMDVSTAVQLDRLEEIERALAEIDPTQFLRADGPDPTVTKPGSFDDDDPSASGGGYESVENGTGGADSSYEPDLSAIVASDDRTTDHSNEDS